MMGDGTQMISINVYTLKQFKDKEAPCNLANSIIRTPRDAYAIIQNALDLEHESSEHFGILTLNTKNGVAGLHVIAIGTLYAALIHPREVFKAAIMNNAASLICFHNHPSGDPTPSQADIELTDRLTEAGEIVGIEVKDHIIIGDGTFQSLLKYRAVS